MTHSVGREVGVMALVVLVGGILAYIPPPPSDSPAARVTSAQESR